MIALLLTSAVSFAQPGPNGPQRGMRGGFFGGFYVNALLNEAQEEPLF